MTPAHDHTLETLARAQGAPVLDPAGEKIGVVEEIFYDDASGRPEWIGVGTGLLHTKRVVVPVEGAALEDDGLRVPYARELVRSSPDVDGDELSPATERELHAHYGVARAAPAPETESVAVPVTVRREVARVVRQPIGETVAEAQIGEAEFELPLHAETPVVR